MATPAGARHDYSNPHLRVVPSVHVDEFDDLAVDDVVDGEFEVYQDGYTTTTEYGIDLEDAVSEASEWIDDAISFIDSDIMPEWEDAEEFYDGHSDVPKQEGRSQVTKTVVRDSIRAFKPNAMRVFVQADAIVEYEAWDKVDQAAAAVAFQQTTFINQLFWRYDGYSVLLDIVHNSATKKIGVLKACYQETVKDSYYNLSNVHPQQVMALESRPGVTLLSAEQLPNGLFRAEVSARNVGGKIVQKSVPLHEFFVDDTATCPEDAKIIGERRNVTVSYARSIGLEHDDWTSLDAHDPEDYEASGESHVRRGYQKDTDEQVGSIDPAKHMFLLTECYIEFDLDGTGLTQLYRFFLGGTSYDYIAHDRVEETPYSVCCIDPMPDTLIGRSLFDILREDQNTQTSLLRATCDNAHLSNNVRLAHHERLVNGKDVVNTKLGAPIRFKQPGMIQEIGVQSSIGSMLPLMQYLDEGSEVKAGITKAAHGLDSDALQSTDKEAVKNTIMLSQGQVELMVRNISETGLASHFRKLLKLSIRHNPRNEVIMTANGPVPIDQYMFEPDATMKTSVGLGQPDQMMVINGLQQVATKQQEIIAKFGMNNPICNMQQHFNTIIDLGAAYGINNMSRYFNAITPETAGQLDAIVQQQQQAAQPEQPSQAVVAGETIRAQARIQEQILENQQDEKESDRQTRVKMVELLMRDDLERDKMQLTAAGKAMDSVDKGDVLADKAQERIAKMMQYMADLELRQQEMRARQATQSAQPVV